MMHAAGLGRVSSHRSYHPSSSLKPARVWTRSIRPRATDDQARQALSSKEKVVQLINSIGDNMDKLGPAVEELILSCPIPKNQLATQSFVQGQGKWKVVHAPHIARMSALLGTKFEIHYTLEGSKLLSHVKYSSPFLGSGGWLSAAGTMARKHDDAVEVMFDTFWIDGPDSLRINLPVLESSIMDKAISLLGRSAFFPQLAVFPVHYLDQDLCVFEFPPLNSKLCVMRE